MKYKAVDEKPQIPKTPRKKVEEIPDREEIEIGPDEVEIASDDFRTGFRLITKSSNRDDLITNKEKLMKFLETHDIIKKGRKYYLKKK